MNDQKKPIILHVIQTLGPGGAERLLVTYLSQPVLKDAFQHIVVLTDIKDPGVSCQGTFLVKALEEQGVEVIGIGSPGPRHLLKSIFQIRQIIKKRQVKLVHSHLIWSNIAARVAARLSGIPVISSFHNSDYDPQVLASFRAPGWKQNFIKWLDGWTARNCDQLSIAVSQYVARHVQEKLYLDPKRIEVIYNPVDTDHIKPESDLPRIKMREELGISPDAKIILSVGRVTDQKAIIEMVEAFEQIRCELPDEKLHLVLVGSLVDPNYLARLKTKITSLRSQKEIFLVGPRMDIGNWLAAADIFAFPTKFEGLGIALAEAMASGLPCVATDVGPIPELIENEKTGLLVSLNHREELVLALKRMITEKEFAQSLGLAASQFIRSKFVATDKAEQLYNTYRRFMK
jgi:glycosyltransferase involved in cell wall biosynthesis